MARPVLDREMALTPIMADVGRQLFPLPEAFLQEAAALPTVTSRGLENAVTTPN
jgi:hypothetical protein